MHRARYFVANYYVVGYLSTVQSPHRWRSSVTPLAVTCTQWPRVVLWACCCSAVGWQTHSARHKLNYRHCFGEYVEMATEHAVFRCPEQHVGVHRPGRQLSSSVASVERVGALDLIQELGTGSYGQIYTAVQNFGEAGQVTVGM